jgi:hypothetical protein
LITGGTEAAILEARVLENSSTGLQTDDMGSTPGVEPGARRIRLSEG